MKKILSVLVALGVFAVVVPAEAKSYVSASYQNKYERLGARKAKSYFRRIDSSGGDGTLTLEEFKSLKLGNWERKENRQLMKEGKYKTQDAQFKAMDKNKDGKVDKAEMQTFFAMEAYERWPSRNDTDKEVREKYTPKPEDEIPEDSAVADRLEAETGVGSVNTIGTDVDQKPKEGQTEDAEKKTVDKTSEAVNSEGLPKKQGDVSEVGNLDEDAKNAKVGTVKSVETGDVPEADVNIVISATSTDSLGEVVPEE